MDFSKNIGQSSNFSKAQYSLHCTVKYEAFEDRKHIYLYHLSDEMQHDYAFTTAVVDNILDLDTHSDIIRFSSDNCSRQYKPRLF